MWLTKTNMNGNLTKLNCGIEGSKLLRTKLNWKLMKLNEEVTKMGGKTYMVFPPIFVTSSFNIINFQFNFVRRSLLHSNLKFNFVKLSFTFVFLSIKFNNSAFKFKLHSNCHWNSSLSLSELRMQGSNSSFFQTNSLFCHSIRQVLLGLYIWETILIETLTKMNANRRNWFCCLVLSYCDRRIWIAVDENGWQSTKLNGNVSKLIDQRRNWNEHSHIPEGPGRNYWKHIF